MSRRARIAVGVIVAVSAVANMAWIARDHEAPPWDQAHYLSIIEQWRAAVRVGGLAAAPGAIFHTDPSHPPLYMLAIAPFELLSRGVTSAVVANTVMLALLIVVTAALAAHLFGSRAAVIAAVFIATAPMVLALSRTVLVDLLLVLLTTACVLAAVRSDGFTSRRWAVAVGLLAGLATLTKPTAPMIVALPTVVVLLTATQRIRPVQLANAALAGVVAVVVASTWYIPNFTPVMEYFRSATGGGLALGTTAEPLSSNAIADFLSDSIGHAAGVGMVVAVLVGGVSLALRVRRRDLDRRRLGRYLVPATLFAVPFIVIGVSNNQDVRFVVPGVPGLAILAAAFLTRMRPPVFRTVATVGLLAVAVLQAASYSVATPWNDAPPVSRYDGLGGTWPRRPGVPDYGTPIVDALERRRVRSGASRLTVCVLSTHPVVNLSTLGYLVDTLRYPIDFVDLAYQPDLDAAGWYAALSKCPVALALRHDDNVGRVGVLNRSSGARHLDRASRSLFAADAQRLPVGHGADVEILDRAP